MTHTFETIEINGTIKALFTSDRLKQDEIPEGYKAYHIRDSDDGTDFATVEAFVMVNHAGTILVREPIDLGEERFLEINDYNFTDEHIDI